MRHVLCAQPVERDRMGARCGELMAPDLGWAASPAVTEGGAAATAVEAAA